MATVNTVLGPISSDDLGVTLMHEHILYGYPGWDGDRTIAPLDRQAIVAAGVETLKQLKDEYGLNSYVDATALDGGRMPDILKEVSEKSGVNIICSTGYYYEGEGSPTYWKFRSSLGDVSGELYDLFMTEVTEGIMDTGIKAGALKVGSSKGEITDYEKLMFQTAAKVSKETGVPIITHTQEGTMGPEQAELLIAAGANPKQIQIGHMSDNTDINYQEETFKHGVYVSWDRMGLQGLVGCPMDAERIPVMIELIKKGYADKMMISHDFIITWLGRPLNLPEEALPLIANWHPSHLFKNIIPAFKEAGVTDEQINSIIKENPRRLFAGE
ncbi:phosphotriesterase family protein [Desulfatibacillum aliphaticivorans]|uniref:phosphotriesterase family protein n=1 Tax=Desulfatibacillum aliphaticivorans TaxID=218208 RepID=UPI00041AEB2A|nr:phosphotriesterase [Desulfatibacillum aliphaticivorans]